MGLCSTADFLIGCIIFVALAFYVFGKRSFISSDNKWLYPLGMALNCKIIVVALMSIIIVYKVLPILLPILFDDITDNYSKWQKPLIIFAFFCIVIYFARRFIKVFKFDSRYQKDACNHIFQTFILAGFGMAILFVIIHFDVNQENFLPFGFFATLLGLLFQDSIKGVVAYYHLRSNGLLHIGDWIEVPSHKIDGFILDISLVTVTVRNWDNTISNIAVALLQSGAFKNNQEMLDGKTSGRRMYRTFIIDSRSICSLTLYQANEIRKKIALQGEDTIVFDHVAFEGSQVLNIHLYRMYLRHWLMNDPDVTRLPRLLVRLMEPVVEGIPLQIYTYILKTSIAPYELVQSRIMEHVMLSMEWFGLRLYQQPSSYDISRLNFEFDNDVYDEKNS